MCDLILINCYPFWEGSDINKAAQYQEGVYRVIKNIAMGKQVIITKTGRPDEGVLERMLNHQKRGQ